jgi:hypothetical protein
MALPAQVRTLLEYWIIGVLECWQKRKPEFHLELVFSLLHYSTTPSLQQTAQKGERLLHPPRPSPLALGSLL